MKRLLLLGATSLLFALNSSGTPSTENNVIKVETSCGEETWLFIEKGTEIDQVLEDVKAIEELLCGEDKVQ